jgi:hypothetical protein
VDGEAVGLAEGSDKGINEGEPLGPALECCCCDANTIAPRAPALDELWLRLEPELGSFVDVCRQPVECDPTSFVSQFSETTILALDLERGTVLSEAKMLELKLV